MSYEIGVSKMTKNILGTDYDFTYVGDKDGQAVFMCDTNVEECEFDINAFNNYDNSALKAKVATYGSEYFIPTVIDITNWTNTDISTLDSDGQVKLNSNSPVYSFIKATYYWTSSACPGSDDRAYYVDSRGDVRRDYVGDALGVRPCFIVANAPTPSTKPSIKLGTLVRSWKVAYTPASSLEIGVSKMTKNILGTDYGFTYVGDKGGQAVFMCDTSVEEYVFNADWQKVDANKYEGSDLETRVATYGSEYFIPTVQDIANWTDTDISRLDSNGDADLNSNSPVYDFIRADYWTSSAYPKNANDVYNVASFSRIIRREVYDALGVRPCFAISK